MEAIIALLLVISTLTACAGKAPASEAPMVDLEPPLEENVLLTEAAPDALTYQVEIEKVSLLEGDPNRNMVVKVTDPRLLEETGGILQGMSGSPLIQDGMLVGVVTQVGLPERSVKSSPPGGRKVKSRVAAPSTSTSSTHSP